MKKKVMLINTLPRLDYWEIIKEPIIGLPYGLLCVGTSLWENGFEVVIIDPQVERDFLNRIEKNLDGCLFVGLSVMTAGVVSGKKISEFIRKLNPNVPIIWGGIHPTLFPEQTLEAPLIDIIVWGEGEETSIDLATALIEGETLEKVRGIGFKVNGRQLFTNRRDFINLEEAPFPNYDLLDMDKYLYRNLETLAVGSGRVKIAVVHSSRGCPYNCTFCINAHPSQRYRPKSFERLIKEVEIVVKRYNPDVIYFQDDNFFANKLRTFKFFEEYEKRDYHFRWFSLTRANYFNREYLSDQFIGRICNSCLWLGLGVESGSDRVRKLINKDISEEQVMAAAQTLGKCGIPTGYAFMVGLPSETEEEMLSTISFMLKIKEIHPQAQFAYQYYRPYPGSELYNLAIQEGFVPPNSLQEWAQCQDMAIGYISIDNLPWIHSIWLVKYLMNVVSCLVNDRPKALKGVFLIFWWFYRVFWILSFQCRKAFYFWGGCGLEVSVTNSVKQFARLIIAHFIPRRGVTSKPNPDSRVNS
jgi:radical SAM superfamily enzyme YgiQ (UPF0313 family)